MEHIPIQKVAAVDQLVETLVGTSSMKPKIGGSIPFYPDHMSRGRQELNSEPWHLKCYCLSAIIIIITMHLSLAV